MNESTIKAIDIKKIYCEAFLPSPPSFNDLKLLMSETHFNDEWGFIPTSTNYTIAGGVINKR